MSDGPVVSNASPLIALAAIGQLGLLQELFGTVLVPTSVIKECRSIEGLPEWIEQRVVPQSVDSLRLGAALGMGEQEAIVLALETGARWVLLDDRAARRSAEARGLQPLGTLGILLAAKRRGYLPAVQPAVALLLSCGFRITKDLIEEALATADESQP